MDTIPLNIKDFTLTDPTAFYFIYNSLWKNPNKLFGQPKIKF